MASAPADSQYDLDQIAGPETLPEIRIYSHSALFYWWPIWVVGYILAAVTAAQGERVPINGQEYIMHPSQYMGLGYATLLAVIILLTTVTLRGLSSVVVVLVVVLTGVTLAWMQWLDDLVAMIPYVGVYMNLGFYVFLSTTVFIMWVLSFFVFDRMRFWRIRPGQMTYERWIGDAEKSYDTRGMVFEKFREDYFKQFLLGLGTGDLHMTTSGARSEEIYIHNVTRVDWKVDTIQKLIAIKPDDFRHTAEA